MVQTKRTAEEFSRVISCDYCSRHSFPKLLRDDSFNLPQPGYIGSNYSRHRVLLVGQNPGVSPPRFQAQDREFAGDLIAVRDRVDSSSMTDLKNALDRIVPTWPVGRHFPLEECGLQLDDIACINVVRCRTTSDAAPSLKITQACIDNHFVRWLDWLQPRVVVCIGKWAHDNVSAVLEERDIPHTFINRQRSLGASERWQNRADAVATVRSVLTGNAPEVSKRAGTVTPREADSVGRQRSLRMPVQSPTGAGTRMDAELYLLLLAELGYLGVNAPNDGRLLRHRNRTVPRLYFNRSREGVVYFVGYAEEQRHFHARLWDMIPPQKGKDDKPNLITMVPKAGMERAALADVLG